MRYFTNEFWTARQRQAHRIHEISYRACFKPQLPGFFIEHLTDPGDIVYDPFMGRGTTAVEAAIHGRIPYGNDTNPLSVALTEPRINPPTLHQVWSRLGQIPWGEFRTFKETGLLEFYHPTVLAQIEGLRRWFFDRERLNLLDKTDRWIRMVALNRLTGHSSGFFSVYTLPPNQAISVKRQRKINLQRKQRPPLRKIDELIYRKSKSLLSEGTIHASDCLFLTGQSDQTPSIKDGVVALVVTSPPFLDVINYEADNWLRCWFIGVEPSSVQIANHRKLDDWQEFVRSTFVELVRVTRSGGSIAFEVGEIRGGEIELERNVVEAARGLPLEAIGVMVNQQDFTKTSNCWGVSNNKAGTNTNRIVIFKRI